MTEDLIKSVVVPVSPHRAFERFTGELNSWWPVDRHSVSAGQGTVPEKIELEPRIGGSVTEILKDWTHSIWGQIIQWQPPAGFTMSWHPGKGPEQATRLALQFEREGNGTSVSLIHSGWEALAESASEIQDHYSSGWDHVLGHCYARACGQPD
ncbi:MAG: SRPBCC domain-containing protein [Paracoccaceae bacterium]